MKKNLFLGANWKMNEAPTGALEKNSVFRSPDPAVEIVVFATALELKECVAAGLTTGAQHGSADTAKAHTGDLSMGMLKKAGATHVLCGHSECRDDRGEKDQVIADQVVAAIAAGLTPVLCVGETESQYKGNETKGVLACQLETVVSKMEKNLSEIIIAYEPRWAIGKGKTPTITEITTAHDCIRSVIKNDDVRIIYGGSLSDKNCEEILSLSSVQGGLIGGASLKTKEFGKIVEAATKIVNA